MKAVLRFCLFAMLVGLLPGLAQSQSVPTTVPPGWQDLGCDPDARVDTLRTLDFVMPFYPNDTLAAGPAVPIRVFIVLAMRDGRKYWAGVAGGGPGARPILLANAPSPAGWQSLPIHWVEQTYLRALVDQHEYLYSRWEPLLSAARRQFVLRRDSLVLTLRKFYPRYIIRPISDLRTAGTQARFLRWGSSIAPLSQHQFGLATDIGFIGGRRLLNDFNIYARIGPLADRFAIIWGGNFVGFIDPSHVQYLRNSATLLRQFPQLRFEFEPYRKYYLRRVAVKIEQGREKDVFDTQELLAVLNDLRTGRPCPCQLTPPPASVATIQRSLQATGYQPANDILILADLPSQTLVATRGVTRLSFKLGKWR